MRRAAVVAAAFAALALAPAASAARGRADLRPAGPPDRDPVRAADAEADPDRGEGDGDLPRHPEGEELARPLLDEDSTQFVKQATYDKTYKDWDVKVWWGKAGEVADRAGGRRSAAPSPRRGPGRRSRGRWRAAGRGRSAGRRSTAIAIWLGFCAVFLIGLADLRRPWALRNLDLLALLSFSVSLWYFNHGHVFASVVARLPGALLPARAHDLDRRSATGPPRRRGPLWPVWLLAAATVFVAGFKVGLNVRDSNVIDVGYAGVIGAERIAHGQSPYNHFPVEDNRKACGLPDRDGEIRERIQTNGRCESANPNGDTYGPVSYLVYLPGYAFFGWTGKWDDLPAAHFTSIAFDLLCLVGLGLVGRRFGGNRLGVTLAFAWAAYPFTQYVSNSNTNDSIMPCFLIWGLWLCTLAVGTRRVQRARRVDEVRGAARRAALGDLSGVPAQPPHGAEVRRRLPGSRRSRASGCSCSSRASSPRCTTSGSGRSRRR